MTYVFKCPENQDHERVETPDRESAPICIHEDEHRYVKMVRDWRAENARMQTFTSALGDGKVQARTVRPVGGEHATATVPADEAGR